MSPRAAEFWTALRSETARWGHRVLPAPLKSAHVGFGFEPFNPLLVEALAFFDDEISFDFLLYFRQGLCARGPFVFDQHQIIFLRFRQSVRGGVIRRDVLFFNHLVLLALFLAVFHYFDQTA